MTLQAGNRLRRSRGGALLLISVLMIGSALIRLGLEAGPALALERAAGSGVAEPAQPRPDTPQAEELQALLLDLLRREDELKRQEAELVDRLRALEVADQAIGRKLTALIETEEKLKATLALADTAAESDLTRLTDVYEKMKPKEAAALFEEMDPGFAAGFLARMRPEAAAGVMAGLTPQAAYTISVVLAGRNAAAPRE